MELSILEAPQTDTRVDALLDDPRAIVRLRVLRAARKLIAERGLSVSMEEIAEVSGLARRTLFRHFEGREELTTAALSSALDWYDGRVADLVRDDLPLETWLHVMVTTLHRVHLASGRGLWELAASRDEDLGADLGRINARRRTARRTTTKAIAAEAWRRADGIGPCPNSVIDACALTMSSFATQSMLLDFGRSADAVAASTAAMLASFLRSEAMRSRGDGSDTSTHQERGANSAAARTQRRGPTTSTPVKRANAAPTTDQRSAAKPARSKR